MLKFSRVMQQTFSDLKLEKIYARLHPTGSETEYLQAKIGRRPVHVVYGGANLFKAGTPQKLGRLALKSLETYAPNFSEFARAMRLGGADDLPRSDAAIADLENQLSENEKNGKAQNYAAWLAWTIYRRTVNKLTNEPVEDFRIDFEDGYGFRLDAEEDSHAISASGELAKLFLSGSPHANQSRDFTRADSALADARASGFMPPFCGFRIKSFQTETYRRAVRTLDLFLTNLLGETGGELPENFVVTLPKITRKEEVEILDDLLTEFEKRNNLSNGAIKIEIMIETPQSIVDEKGAIALPSLVKAAGGRCAAAHFGAFDYTASLGIAGTLQGLRHEACDFARSMMQIALAPLGVRLSDSVTTEMPVPIHRGENLSSEQLNENKNAVHKAWRTHFENVTHSLVAGFYQSWDLHPAQLAARYAAVYAFFLENADAQAARLKGFIEKAAQASLTGNTFDDAASAQGLLNFFNGAVGCGAFDDAEVQNLTGLSAEKLKSLTINGFVQESLPKA